MLRKTVYSVFVCFLFWNWNFAQDTENDLRISSEEKVVEAKDIEAGEIDPDEVHLSGVYVDHLIQAADNEKRIERLRETNAGKVTDISGGRGRIVRRAAKEFKDGSKSSKPRIRLFVFRYCLTVRLYSKCTSI